MGNCCRKTDDEVKHGLVLLFTKTIPVYIKRHVSKVKKRDLANCFSEIIHACTTALGFSQDRSLEFVEDLINNKINPEEIGTIPEKYKIFKKAVQKKKRRKKGGDIRKE